VLDTLCEKLSPTVIQGQVDACVKDVSALTPCLFC
jgi:hypothetical protein